MKLFRSSPRPPYLQRDSQYAFTLIELLVVIAILGLLSSLVVPVVSSALERTRKTTCTSNLRQMGQAVNLYALEHGGKYPWGRYDICRDPDAPKPCTSTKGTQDWRERLLPFIPKSQHNSSMTHGFSKVFNCPSSTFSPQASPNKKTHSYGANKEIFVYGGEHPSLYDRVQMTVHGVRRPAQTLLISDAGFDPGKDWQGLDPKSAESCVWVTTTFQKGGYDVPCPRHGRNADPTLNKVNILYADGHIGDRTYADMRENRLEILCVQGAESGHCK
jgi:prepilin-type N-terminal cleavage/methylation domain-containing protein/prepilin-type processing-associated H-X9-DG protein